MLAYIDSFGGLVPCKVLRIDRRTQDWRIHVKITADRPGYKKGTCDDFNTYICVPRKAIYRKNYQYRIMGYSWVDLVEKYKIPTIDSDN